MRSNLLDGKKVANDNLLRELARDHNVELFAARQAVPGLLNATTAQLRKRVQRQTVARGQTQ